MERWAGRLALVTGCSSGIGSAIVKELLKNGLKVVGCARRVERIEELGSDCKNLAGQLFPFKCDLAKNNEIESMFKWIKETIKMPVSICVNNAGMSYDTPLLEMTAEEMNNMLAVNVVGLVLCSNLSIKSMKENNIDDGHIVHLSSMMGHPIGLKDKWAFYSATKFAVDALTEGYRRELVKDTRIRVTAISPGRTLTEFAIVTLGEEVGKKIYNSAIERKSIMTAEDVCSAVIYSLSAPENVQIHDILRIRAEGPKTVRSKTL